MNSVSSSKNTTILLVIALSMALLFAVYYYVVKPKQDDAESVSREVTTLKAEISSLEENLVTFREQQSQTNINEFALRKKVPATRAIDTLILSMEEIEYVTGSRILSIDFNNYDEQVSASGLEDPNATTETKEQETTEETQNNEQSEALPVSTIAVENLPPSLKLITFNINVMSPNNENLQQFIKEVEKIERVMHIDTIDFSLPVEENIFLEDATDVVFADVQVTTFYYE